MIISRHKRILVTLTCLMLVSLLLMNIMTQAQPTTLFTVHLMTGPEPVWLDIVLSFKNELAKIGINLEVEAMDWGAIWDITWELETNKLPFDEGGWDMDYAGWYWMFTDLIWFEGCYSSWSVLPWGWNYYNWQNSKADGLLRNCLSTLDPDLRQGYAWKWQKEFMHDPPHISLYYTRGYEVTAADLEGWNQSISWWYQAWPLRRTGTTPEEDVTLKYGSDSDLTTLNPVFMYDLSDEAFCNQHFGMLMTTTVDPETGGALVVPYLARELPEYSLDGLDVTVRLRENVTWHDGVQFNATDVKFTFDAVIDPDTWSAGYGDFSPIIDWVEISDEFTVVFHLKEPTAPGYFNALLADDYGGMIIPEHSLRGVPHGDWNNHPTNTEWPMPGTGPWKLDKWVRDEYWLVEKNPDFVFGEPMIDRIYNVIITDPHTMLVALQTYEIDFGDGWMATMDEIDEMRLDPLLKVTEEPIPYIEFFSFNLYHPILSNRYVRQAMANMVPYEHIINDLLPLSGSTGTRPTAPVHPVHGYLYNTELEPFDLDQTLAEQYLNLWRGLDPDNPAYIGYPTAVGDADFSGLVDLDDFLDWRENFGKPKEEWSWYPGDGVDPDFDNNREVDLADYEEWRLNSGEYYPFKGAR